MKQNAFLSILSHWYFVEPSIARLDSAPEMKPNGLHSHISDQCCTFLLLRAQCSWFPLVLFCFLHLIITMPALAQFRFLPTGHIFLPFIHNNYYRRLRLLLIVHPLIPSLRRFIISPSTPLRLSRTADPPDWRQIFIMFHILPFPLPGLF